MEKVILTRSAATHKTSLVSKMRLDFVSSRLYLLMIALAVFSSCSDDPEVSHEAQLKIDTEKIEAYVTSTGLQNVQTTSSGLYYIITETGTGNLPRANELVAVHYEGKLLDGTKFDSSFDRNIPISFVLGANQVIRGWDEGIQLMSEESKGVLIIPSYLAYGTTGSGSIGPNEVLVFDVEVLSDDQLFALDKNRIDTYISANSIENVQSTDTGLQYTITTQGSGSLIESGNSVSMNYKGYFLDGSVFDQTNSTTFDYVVGNANLIAGWEEGVRLLNKGASATFFLPAKLAYGKEGVRNNIGATVIPGNQVLIFDIEIVDVN